MRQFLYKSPQTREILITKGMANESFEDFNERLLYCCDMIGIDINFDPMIDADDFAADYHHTPNLLSSNHDWISSSEIKRITNDIKLDRTNLNVRMRGNITWSPSNSESSYCYTS